MIGVIKALIKKREGGPAAGTGYGFILDANHSDRFFHARNLVGVRFEELREGMKVEFEPVSIDGKGERAESVRVVS